MGALARAVARDGCSYRRQSSDNFAMAKWRREMAIASALTYVARSFC
jgi:hypothetical protein